MTTNPLISVVLPLYNAEKYIKESVESVLSQTFTDFEFIIINDGSKDNSGDVVRSIKDDRIVYVEQSNIGLPATLNRGISMARADIIARQDNDDLSLPTRFEKQYQYLSEHPEVAVLGARAEIMNENGRSLNRYHDHPTDKNVLKFVLLFNNPFVHSSVMFRKSVLQKSGEYYTGKEVFEDFNLWSRISRVADVANLPDRLLRYREVNSSMSRVDLVNGEFIQKVMYQSSQNIKFYCPNATDEKIKRFINYAFGIGEYKNFKEALGFSSEFLNEIVNNFCDHNKIAPSLLKEEVKKQMLGIRRSYYNKIIDSKEAGVFEKLTAKVQRKIMFMNNKEYLS